MADLSRIKNDTIAKLNRIDISDLGLNSQGIFTYKGTLKSRVKNYKTEKVNDHQINFSTHGTILEFIKIQSLSDTDEYALRVKDILTDRYAEFYPVLWGCKFFK